MQKLQNTILWTIIVSEASHIFCCILPTIFSVLSLLAGIGLVGIVPVWLVDLHETLHDWEVPLIMLSGVVVVLGWALFIYSRKIDCHDTGCEHEPCAPKKKTAGLILKGATLLFFINVLIYGIFHRGMGVFVPSETVVEQAHEGHDH